MITQISYQSLKGRTEDIALGKATLIYGANFAGKTTIIDAIKLALLGYHPSLDKTARGVMELASGDELSVSAILDDGKHQRTIGRKWTRIGDKVTKKDFLPIDWPDTPVVLLDSSAYFGATDRGKAELLFAAAKFDDLGKCAAICAKLSEFGLNDFMVPGQTTGEWVENALREIEKQRSEAAASTKRYADTMQGLSALRASNPMPLNQDLAEELTKKRREMDTAEGKLRSAQIERNVLDRAQPDDVKLDEANRRVKTLASFIAQKEIEIGKAETRWHELLKHEDCPMCGTKSEHWRFPAVERKDAEMKQLEGEKLELTRERNNVQHFVDTETPRSEADKKKAMKSAQRKVDDHEETIAGLREEIARLERELNAYHEDKAERKRLAEAREKHEHYAALETNLKAAKKYLLETKAEMATQLFEPILKTARVFTDGILRFQLGFNEDELGMWETHPQYDDYRHWIPNRTFSGTEQAIAFAAFQAALGATAPIKLVIVDELNRLTQDNQVRLLVNAQRALTDGIIDQFIGVIAGGKLTLPRPLNDFTLIERPSKD